jgi:hypothetical protein
LGDPQHDNGLGATMNVLVAIGELGAELVGHPVDLARPPGATMLAANTSSGDWSTVKAVVKSPSFMAHLVGVTVRIDRHPLDGRGGANSSVVLSVPDRRGSVPTDGP